MKVGLSHPLFSVMLSTFALISVNVIPQFLATDEILPDESDDQKLNSLSVDFMDEEVKTENTHNSSATDINVRRQSEPEAKLHIAEIVPEYENSEKSRRPFMDPYDSRFGRHNLFDKYRQRFEPLHFYQKANGIPSFRKRMLGDRRYFEKKLLNNPSKADALDIRPNFATLDSGVKSPFLKKVPLLYFLPLTNVPKTAITFSPDSKWYENDTARIKTENANTEPHLSGNKNWNVQYTVPFKSSVKNRNVLNDSVERLLRKIPEYFRIEEVKNSRTLHKIRDLSESNEKAPHKVPAVPSPRGRIFLRDEATNENFNPKRVYFEK